MNLKIVDVRMRMAWTFVVPIALVAGLAFLRAAAELLPSRQRKPTRPAGADATGPSSEAD